MGLTRTLAELQGYYPARLTFRIEDVLPAIQDGEEEYLVEQILGRDFYDELLAAYDGNTLTAEQTAVVNLCRRATVNLGLLHALDSLNVTLQSTGLGVVNNSDIAPASQSRTNALKAQVLRAGYRGLDRLIAHLIDNAADYPTWADADNTCYTDLVGGLLRTTRDFEHVVRIGNSGWLFHKMRPTIRLVEEGPVATTLCSDALYQDLLTKVAADTLDEHETKVVKQARVAIAHLTMAESITKLSLTIDKGGIWAFTTLAAGDVGGGPVPVDGKRLDALAAQFAQTGSDALEKLTALCQQLAEADNLPLYAASDCYVDPDASPEPETDDSDDAVFGGF